MPLIVAVNLGVGKPWANTAGWIAGGFAAWGIALSGAINLIAALASGGVTETQFALYAGFVVSGVAAGGFLFKSIRRDVSAILPIDPESPVHTLALVLAVILFGTQATPLLFTDVFALYMAQPPQTLAETVVGELSLLILGVVGVGIFIRRTWKTAAIRLALVRPAWWQIALALAAAGVFLGLIQGFDSANHYFLPSVAGRVDATDTHIFGQLVQTSWIGIAALSLLPGICEDVLFRGALQPRLGLLPTAVLFTSFHTQYGLSLDLAGVFVIAVGLGLVRKYTNTTTSVTTHAVYNLLTGISGAIGLGAPGAPLYAAVGLEVVLLAAAGYGVWRVRRAADATASP